MYLSVHIFEKVYLNCVLRFLFKERKLGGLTEN